VDLAGEKGKGRQRPAVRVYKCQQHYQECPVRALFSPRQDGRRIELNPLRSALMWQRAKRQDPVQQALLRRRKAIVEPVFATLKQAMGFRRWTVRGLENVRTQLAMLCTTCNLKKPYKHWAARQRAGTGNPQSPGSTASLRLLAALDGFPAFRRSTCNPSSPTLCAVPSPA
jgi:hypothetical protein